MKQVYIKNVLGKRLVKRKKILYIVSIIKTRKLLSIVLATILMLTFSVSALAQTREVTITVHNDAEILAFLNSDQYDANIKYSFFITNPAQPKTICYMCGKPGLTSGEFMDEWRHITVTCPANEWTYDIVTEYRVYETEICTYCDHELIGQERDREWTVLCQSDQQEWKIIPGATMEDGYYPHECIVI